jgi:hypothetical protein
MGFAERTKKNIYIFFKLFIKKENIELSKWQRKGFEKSCVSLNLLLPSLYVYRNKKMGYRSVREI